jgi:lipoprotein NlpI
MRSGFLSAGLIALAAVSGLAQAEDKPKPQCDGRYAASGAANIAACTAALKEPGLRDDDRATMLNIRGNNYDFTKQYDLAIADYSDVIRLKQPVLLEYAYANRGLEECRKGLCADALADYEQALRLDPDNDYARYGRGIARLRSGDAKGGKADIDAVNARGDDTAEIYVQIGMTP